MLLTPADSYIIF